MYHSVEPPSYDLGSISSPPLAIFHGGRDRLADERDVQTLLQALPPDAVVYSQVWLAVCGCVCECGGRVGV